MRKAAKGEFGKHLKDKVHAADTCNAATLLIDGGWLTHQIPWASDKNFSAIGDSFVDFVKNKSRGRATVVVFDGYNHSPKDHEHKRRLKGSTGCAVIPSKPCLVVNAKFLTNEKNKSSFIAYLCSLLQHVGIETVTTHNDCDTMLVKRSLQLSGSGESGRSVEVMAEDTTDVLVIILHHSTTSSHTLYFTTQSGTDDVMEIYD